jgi:hypothetical protein
VGGRQPVEIGGKEKLRKGKVGRRRQQRGPEKCPIRNGLREAK